MEQQFNEEMLRQMYRRWGYQIFNLCSETGKDRRAAIDLTFRIFGEAAQKLKTSPDCSEPMQDDLLFQSAREILRQANRNDAAPAEEEPQQYLTRELPAADALLEVIPAEESVPEPVSEAEPEPAETASVSYIAPVEHYDLDAELTAQPEQPTAVPVEEPAPAPKKVTVGWFLLLFLLILIIFLLLWAIWGVAQTLFPIPKLDLGYQWFNTYVYPLF